MTLRQLEVFLAVARDKSFSLAAKRIHLSQPTASEHMQELEKELGAALFTRRGRAIAMTEAGRVFETYAARIMSDVADARQAQLRHRLAHAAPAQVVLDREDRVLRMGEVVDDHLAERSEGFPEALRDGLQLPQQELVRLFLHRPNVSNIGRSVQVGRGDQPGWYWYSQVSVSVWSPFFRYKRMSAGSLPSTVKSNCARQWPGTPLGTASEKM